MLHMHTAQCLQKIGVGPPNAKDMFITTAIYPALSRLP
jgi:hypothetical protein